MLTGRDLDWQSLLASGDQVASADYAQMIGNDKLKFVGPEQTEAEDPY